jgi:enoyl-CoA hydratase
VDDRYAEFATLTFERPHPGVLRIVLDAPNLNAVGPDAHRDLADVWLTVDRDPDVRVALVTGAGGGVLGRWELRAHRADGERLRGTHAGHA